MYRAGLAVLLGLLMAAICLAQESLVGTYTLVAVTRIIDGKLQESTGEPPHGYVVISPKPYAVFYTDGDRKYGTSETERAALWDTMTACGGPYQFDGKRITVSVDTSWNQVNNGTQQVRDVELRGTRMITSSAPRPWGRDPSKQILLRMEWEKIV